MAKKSKVTLGLLVGNRGFFPDHLAESGRAEMIKILKQAGCNVIVPTAAQTKFGCVETYDDAKKCGALFRKNAEKIDGIVVTLPNFGDEKGIAEAIKLSGLDVPVLVHAWPDDLPKMSLANRRDAFCGKMSVCNNLRQYNIAYTLTTNHTEPPTSDFFAQDLDDFIITAAVTSGLRNLRVAAIGARPAAFNTVRYSERILQDSGINVETLDLSEVLGRIGRIKSTDKKLKAKIAALQKYVTCKGIPKGSVEKLAKLGMVLDDYVAENEISALALQCWTAIEDFYGIAPCAAMSMLSNSLVPAACEVDVCGAIAMYILQCASQQPSALLDWNNNYGDDPDKAVMFHCSNMPTSFMSDPKMSCQDILANIVGPKNSYGTIVGRATPGPATFLRINTDDFEGMVAGYIAEGEFTNDDLDTFGGVGVVDIPDLQSLLEHICEMGFEHHVAVNKAHTAEGIAEALNTYMGWDVLLHD